ncbi:hypothetical protein [Variovorax sp. KK3]|uniref:hypothetical protein n=1 Tax=Variovorax sp. KK3 TaxID=1855728 RepID=UPI00117DD957|nr:hypothetical protein [Variovorax sp. KK3]
MESTDEAELERLRLALHSSHGAAAAWREQLIEALGDHMCGSGRGPTPEDIRGLLCLEEAEQMALERYARFLLQVARKANLPGTS